MGRRRHEYSHWCSCRGCKNYRDKAEQEYSEREENRYDNSASTVGLIGEATLGVASFVGLMTNPGDLPDTGDLNDNHTQQVGGYRQSIEEASRDQGTGTSQSL